MITLSKIAKLAHVSVSTASKAFSMSSEVNPETREMIFKIAKEYGCFKKFYNAKYPKLVFAIICPEFKSRFYSDALSLVQEYSKEYNCEICVASTDFSLETEKMLFEYYTKYTSVDAIININGQLADYEVFSQTPVVNFFPSNKADADITVVDELDNALKEHLNLCKQKGISSIGFIGESHTNSKLLLFQRNMEEIFEEYKKEFISISQKRFEDGGFEAMEKLLKGNNLPRIVVCAYDCMAIGAINAIEKRGLKVPGDVAVLGIDDIRESAFLPTPLSSINQNLEKACKEAVDALINRLYDKPYQKIIKVPAELKIRKSSEI
ncbi:MAG: LacI family DNA-binding transcriptional regulator [Clostridia bacterium]|nr:LacI family DNA-binding transcriptional regulator [Clostridia bacterium]